MTSSNSVLFTAIATMILFLTFSVCAEEEEAMAMEDEGMLEEEALEEAEPFFVNEVEFGVIYSSEDSFKFGEYTGLEEEGFYGLGNLFYRQVNANDTSGTRFWGLTGSHLGLDSRSVFAEYGVAGKYSFYIDYDQLPHYRLDDAMTPFIGAGTTNQTLPANWVGAEFTPAMTRLIPSLRQVDVETDRKNVGGGFSWNIRDRWQVTGNYHHEFKEGTDTVAAIFGITGGNPTSSTLIYPVDFETDEFDIGIAYAGDRGHFDIRYFLSVFENNDGSLTWDNPYIDPAYDADANFDQGGRGRMALDPDNIAHHFNLAGGYKLGRTTRVTGTFSYNRMEQDDAFLPMTINPNLAITTDGPTGVPRSDLDGLIENWFVNLAISSRPYRKLNLKGRYTYDFRDNETPRDTYVRVPNDSADQAAADSSNARVNRPYSLERHAFEVDASYRIMPRTKVSAGYEFELIDRNPNDISLGISGSLDGIDFTDAPLNEVDETTEHTGKLKLMASPTDNTQGWVKLLYSTRDGDRYLTPAPFYAGHSAATLLADIAADPTGDFAYEQNFLLRKFNQADRDKNQISGSFSYFPDDKLVVGVSGKRTSEDYEDDSSLLIGLKERDNFSGTLDVSYMPKENITTYAYFTFEDFDNKQRGYDTPFANLPPSATIDTTQIWHVTTEDEIKSAGAGLEWNDLFEGKLDFSMDYSYSRADTQLEFASVGESFLPARDLQTKIHSLNLQGDYMVNSNIDVRFGYRYEYFSTDDFALDGIIAGPGTLNSGGRTITLGNRSPDYNAHVVGLSLIYKF